MRARAGRPLSTAPTRSFGGAHPRAREPGRTDCGTNQERRNATRNDSTANRKAPELVVFSDDWGRHPSSCQHLIRQLLPRYPVAWFNTVGTRRPRLDLYTLTRGAEKVLGWIRSSTRPQGSTAAAGAPVGVPAPRVHRPLMWPSFRSAIGRHFNRRQLTRALQATAGAERRIGVTTLPIVADVIGTGDVDRWIYYCVDDLGQWPGLDRRTLETMERRLVDRVDEVIAVSDVLVERMRAFGRRATLLTHGVDLQHWRLGPGEERAPRTLGGGPPIALFWGLVDRRLDLDWLRRLAALEGLRTIALVGPTNDPDPKLARIDKVSLLGPCAYDELPAVAEAADVLIMPYGEMPATRAMQPLKLKEYLASGKPVVVRRLPATESWDDACDVAATADDFAERVQRRLDGTLPGRQAAARERLLDEGWERKAETFERILHGEPS